MDNPMPFENGNTAHRMDCPRRRPGSRFRFFSPTVIAVILAMAVAAGFSAGAQDVQHLSVTVPGGFPGMPVITGIEKGSNTATITWDGPSGYYQLWQKTNLLKSSWQAVGIGYNLNWYAGVDTVYSHAFFRVSGPAPVYVGASDCESCHAGVLTTVAHTAHAGAFTTALFVAEGGQTNSACFACHTAGYRAMGFVSASKTPLLENVQCENCHGPAGNHAANPANPVSIPQAELAAELCGGCHSAGLAPASVAASHLPYFEDWNSSAHAAVVPEVLAGMSGAVTNSAAAANISNCGRCHSGSARLALINGENPSLTLTNDYDLPVTCAVCHDPHSQHVWTNVLNGVITFTNSLTGNTTVITNNALGLIYTNQLLCALASTNDFVLTSSDNFTNVYRPNINVCAQCHNDAGASWTNTDYPPHASPQYNMLLGTVGQLANGPTPGLPATHSRLEMQCAGCHMQTTNGVSGHTFEVATYQLCDQCHSDPAGLVQLVTNAVAGEIQQTKSYLDLWATTVAPASTNAALASMAQQYGPLAWEYTTPGRLSTGAAGPDAAQQALIPDNIRMARFDLYLVFYDGSYGVHNAPYEIELLQTAQSWIEGQLYQ